MPDYLKHYKLKITALSPVHVGDGTVIKKNEYIRRSKDNTVIIPDKYKMFLDLQKLGKLEGFQKYILNDKNKGLGQWLYEEEISNQQIKSWTKYLLEARDAFIINRNDEKNNTPKNITAFSKDAYGMAYIPGSTIKGMIRTALLSMEAVINHDKYKTIIDALQEAAGINKKNSPKNYLKKETESIETHIFNTLNKNEKRQGDAVNSEMSGLIVSDSEPIPTVQLTLSQKVDYTLEGRERTLPILREALIPGTEIFFDITIDTENCSFTINDIMKALDIFQKNCYECFYKRFGRGNDSHGIVWIGGGTGFLSKTILYQLLGTDAVELVDNIFKNTLGKSYMTHHHENDVYNQLSPHICKCTYYHGRLYDMGMGKIEVI